MSFLPALNATWNGLSLACLLIGLWEIKRGKMNAHRNWMLGALACSTLFLAGYLTYHFTAGITRFGGGGIIRGIYFALLGSHTLLAVSVPPLAGALVWFAFRKNFERHKKLAKFAWPIWAYVSATGVLVYWMLYHSPWKAGGWN